MVNEMVDECRRAVVMKLLEPMRKALTQLYSNADSKRLSQVAFCSLEAARLSCGNAGSVAVRGAELPLCDAGCLGHRTLFVPVALCAYFLSPVEPWKEIHQTEVLLFRPEDFHLN